MTTLNIAKIQRIGISLRMHAQEKTQSCIILMPVYLLESSGSM
jgi:hypothetical protein